MLNNTLKITPVLVLAVMLTTGFGWLFDHHRGGCCPTKTGDAYCPQVSTCPAPCPVVAAPCPVVVEKVVIQKPKKIKKVRKVRKIKRVHKVVDQVIYWPNPTCCPAACPTPCPKPCPVVNTCPKPCPKPCPTACSPCGRY